MLDWQAALERQALAEWRDRQVLAVYHILNNLADEARSKFEASLEQASLKDSVWDPANFADRRIDALMCEAVPSALERLLKSAGRELAAISPTFEPYGNALSASTGFDFPIAGLGEDKAESNGDLVGSSASSDDAVSEASQPQVPASSSWSLGNLMLVRKVSEFGELAANAVWEAGVAAERTLQTRAGLYERLRSAAAARIGTRWMGSAGEPRPVLAQVTDLIDSVCGEARAGIQ